MSCAFPRTTSAVGSEELSVLRAAEKEEIEASGVASEDAADDDGVGLGDAVG
jgi:hypothetical protein